MKKESIFRIFPREMRSCFAGVVQSAETLNEIRIRSGQPVTVIRGGQEFFLSESGEELPHGKTAPKLVFTDGQIEKLFSHICMDSPYAYEQELKKGYLTLTGGHRVGVAGQVIASQGRVESIRNIRFLNIRITHECIGCADGVVEKLYDRTLLNWRSAMLIGPPACGKTTLMRDIIRQISDGTNGRRPAAVGLVDERSEIAGCYLGVPQNRIGSRTDVMDCCPKVCGMEMLLRSMSPQVIAVDEIGGSEDVRALLMLAHSGVKLLVSLHGTHLEEVRKKPHLAPLFSEECFDRFVLLGSHFAAKVVDGRGNVL